MRTVERFAFYFGIVNLVLGIMSLLSPFVRPQRSGMARFLPARRNRGIFNRQTGMLLGRLGAVSPISGMVHSALGAAGLATRPFSRYSRAYMWLNGMLFAAMAALGWFTVGMKPGIRNVKGIAVDRMDNIIHTLFAAGALLLAARPNLGRQMTNDAMNMVEAGLRE